MAIMTHAKFHFNCADRLMLTLIFGIRASEPPLRPAEKAGPDRVSLKMHLELKGTFLH